MKIYEIQIQGYPAGNPFADRPFDCHFCDYFPIISKPDDGEVIIIWLTGLIKKNFILYNHI